jgi:hypothetical protein
VDNDSLGSLATPKPTPRPTPSAPSTHRVRGEASTLETQALILARACATWSDAGPHVEVVDTRGCLIVARCLGSGVARLTALESAIAALGEAAPSAPRLQLCDVHVFATYTGEAGLLPPGTGPWLCVEVVGHTPSDSTDADAGESSSEAPPAKRTKRAKGSTSGKPPSADASACELVWPMAHTLASVPGGVALGRRALVPVAVACLCPPLPATPPISWETMCGEQVRGQISDASREEVRAGSASEGWESESGEGLGAGSDAGSDAGLVDAGNMFVLDTAVLRGISHLLNTGLPRREGVDSLRWNVRVVHTDSTGLPTTFQTSLAGVASTNVLQLRQFAALFPGHVKDVVVSVEPARARVRTQPRAGQRSRLPTLLVCVEWVSSMCPVKSYWSPVGVTSRSFARPPPPPIPLLRPRVVRATLCTQTIT